MFRPMRTIHKWTGAILCLFLATIAVTGFLLATKGTLGWIRPPEKDGTALGAIHEVADLSRVMEAVLELEIPELRTLRDVDRIDYRPKSNIFKVLSKRGYHEVQVDGTSAKVLGVATRNDQLAEDIHDLSFFSDALHDYGLPLVGIGLLALSLTGAVIFAIPYVRRWQFHRKENRENLSSSPKEMGPRRR